MKRLFLADLKNMDEKQLKKHIASEYAGERGYDKQGSKKEDLVLSDYLKGCKFMIAYESTGSWGCDSSSYFLFKKDGELYEVHGFYCSCYGFEGQWEPELTSIKYLKSDKFYFSGGGYDGEIGENKQAILDYIKGMRQINCIHQMEGYPG